MNTNFWIMLVVVIALVIYWLVKKYTVSTESMANDWIKDVVKALLSTLLPILYGLLTDKYPDFPLSSTDFTSLFTWLVFLVFWGTGVYHFAKAGFTRMHLTASKYK